MRKNGVLMHISSLPSPYGIGTLGQAAKDFADDLASTGQSYWQILPLGPTGYGDSPYASYSTFAGNPYFIDLDLLAQDGLLRKEEYENLQWGQKEDQVDFGRLYNLRFPLLRKATERFLRNPDKEYEDFLKKEAYWLDDYALFMALKEKNGGRPWLEWDEPYRKYDAKKAREWARENKDAVDYYKALQYLFFKQWNALKDYANKKGVEFIGDMPIYVAMDSVDAWSQPQLFMLDENGKPSLVAGCPPDAFAADGQLWGNPLYNWDYHKKSGYSWWADRIHHLSNVYNVLRIDHFRGFDSFYAIPFGAKTAKEGKWMTGPGIELFETVEEKLGKTPIIAEDLGFLTDSVRSLLKETGFPGMKILQFAFDSRDGSGSEYLPYNYPKNSIAYTGTHDNETICGWAKAVDKDDLQYAKDYLAAYDPEEFHWEMMRGIIASPADTSIVQMQDLLGLDNEGRMNTPGKLGGNWSWRMLPGAWKQDSREGLHYLTRLYGRDPEEQRKAEERRKAKEALLSAEEEEVLETADARD